MCIKKERKRDRRWYLFPVSTLGAVYFAVHGGTGRFFFFPRRDGVAFFFFDGTGRGGVFVLFLRAGTGRLFFGGGNFFGKGGLNRPASRPYKALNNSTPRSP